MLWSRRALLRSGAAALALRGAAGALVAPRFARGGDEATARTFPLSVASGDPTPSGAVVWTRIDPASHVVGRELMLEVASDDGFRDVVAVERVPASAIGPARDWTVLVDLDGRLASDRRYAYRFRYGDVPSRTGFLRMDATCPGRTADGRTMLGEAQRRWLVDGLSRSDARWKLWATSVPLTPVGYGSGDGRLFLTLDTWAGYEHERRAILNALAAGKVRNLVSLTGDIHTFFAARLHAGEADPLHERPPAVGVELGTGAISAARLGDIAGPISHPDVVLPNNPQVAFWNALANGYAFVEITRDAVVYEPRCFAVDRRLDGGAAQVPGRFRIAEGTPDVVRVTPG